jgi:rod shape-determining protein MreC
VARPRSGSHGADAGSALTPYSALAAPGAGEAGPQLSSSELVLRARAQRLAALSAENLRLRELLNSPALLEENVLVSEIIGISPDPGLQVAVIDKGSSSGVVPGQAVIDASGLFGQVLEAGISSSRVLLLSDATHAVPAQVLRNGVRVVVEG